jgi:hypothetical protein
MNILRKNLQKQSHLQQAKKKNKLGIYLAKEVKRAGRVVPEVECLPTTHEALSLSPSTAKRKKKVKALYNENYKNY